jgi:phosphocarrier protein HPr
LEYSLDWPDMEHNGQVSIANKYGLHARPAAEFVKLASRYAAEVWVSKDNVEVSGKSIMGVMMLAAECGSVIHIRATGDDSRAAVEALVDLVTSKFGEE